MSYILPSIFTQPHNVMEIQRQPKKALRIVNLVDDKKKRDFLLVALKKILSRR